ncbi:MAG TPA: hypothetical protein VGT08_00425 [Terracidiphilus sp.]|nr:hypothetical protein [Terracidiphilus sp.]
MAVVRMPDPPRDLAAVVEQRSGLLTVQNLIQLTGFKKTAIYDMVADGRIPYLRFDSSIRSHRHRGLAARAYRAPGGLTGKGRVQPAPLTTRSSASACPGSPWRSPDANNASCSECPDGPPTTALYEDQNRYGASP